MSGDGNGCFFFFWFFVNPHCFLVVVLCVFFREMILYDFMVGVMLDI